jgi:hypothetical protein
MNTVSLPTQTILPSSLQDHLDKCPWLYAEQRRAVAKLLRECGGMVWWKVGQGKTRIALGWFVLAQIQMGLNPTAPVDEKNPYILTVFCRVAGFTDWYEEAARVGIQHRIECISEAMLQRHGEHMVPQLCAGTNRLHAVLDEGFLYKNHKSRRTLYANLLARKLQVVLLSGSIMTAQKLTDVFGQAVAVGKHKRISPNFTSFMDEYMATFNDLGYPQHFPKRGAYKKLMEKCSPFADIHFPKTSKRAIDSRIVTCNATPEQLAAYEELKSTGGIEAAGLQLNNMAAILVKAMQISGGFIKREDGSLLSIPSNKQLLLDDTLEKILDSNERAVVYCAFRHEVRMLSARCPWTSVCMLGGKPFDLDTWRAGRTRVCFISEASASTVNHFAQIAHAVYYSMDYKWLSLQQSMGRTDRHSSEHDTCYYSFLQVKEGVDAAVYRQVRQSQSREGAMIKLGEEVQAWLAGFRKEKRDVPRLVRQRGLVVPAQIR